MHLTELRIRNYKSISDLLITDIENALILVGKNNTGKTAILDAIRVVTGSCAVEMDDFQEDYANIEISVCLLLSDNDLKMLILGYKHLRRGNEWYIEDHENIVSKQMWLKENLADIINHFKVVSFDNLAIEQLDVQRLMSKEEWDEFYMGDDGTMTYYIDMVERKFAKSSTASFDKRYDLLDSVDKMFQKIVSEN